MLPIHLWVPCIPASPFPPVPAISTGHLVRFAQVMWPQGSPNPRDRAPTPPSIPAKQGLTEPVLPMRLGPKRVRAASQRRGLVRFGGVPRVRPKLGNISQPSVVLETWTSDFLVQEFRVFVRLFISSPEACWPVSFDRRHQMVFLEYP